MKKIQLLLLLCCTVLFFQCKKIEEEKEITVIKYPATPNITLCESQNESESFTSLSIEFTDISLLFPSCFSVNALQGIDSYVGVFEATDEGIEIFYDIGNWAGEYVKEASENQVTVQGIYEVFRYETKDNRLTFTFPNAGPANFYTEQLAHEADLVELFRYLEVN